METIMTLQQEAVPIVRSSIEMKRKALEFNQSQYRQRLSAFEQTHRMTSEQFSAQFKAGALGDAAAWFEWEFAIDALGETSRQLELLENIKL
jgi:hypothetical protein